MLAGRSASTSRSRSASCATRRRSSTRAGHVTNPCLNPIVVRHQLGHTRSRTPPGSTILGFGISILAIISSLVQLVASRQMLAPLDPRMADDQNVKVQRQMAYFLPLISILYGGMLPAGLFLYWIMSLDLSRSASSSSSSGFGGMFPLFGWYPGVRPEPHARATT